MGDKFRQLDELGPQKFEALARVGQASTRVGPQTRDFGGWCALERRLRRFGETAMLS